jgi:hypothetical protein
MIELQVPETFVGSVSALLPRFGELGVQRLEVFSYSRPGEPPYWLAFLITAAGRETLGTPELRHLSLGEQAPDLLRQLFGWNGPRPTAHMDSNL